MTDNFYRVLRLNLQKGIKRLKNKRGLSEIVAAQALEELANALEESIIQVQAQEQLELEKQADCEPHRYIQVGDCFVTCKDCGRTVELIHL